MIRMFLNIFSIITLSICQTIIVMAQHKSMIGEDTMDKSQGLWQQCKGHGLYLDYGYEYLQDLETEIVDYKWPLRFDLTYQYDIPWRAKRVNLFVESGIAYEKQICQSFGNWLLGTNDYVAYKIQRIRQRMLWRFGGGFKIHCTDWLYLSLEGGFQVGYDNTKLDEINQNNDIIKHKSDAKTALFGGQSAMQIVGQIKRVSIHLGYRANHWIDIYRYQLPRYKTEVTILTQTDWFLTAGVGYHF